MNSARIERLTREALGPARRPTYTRMDDGALRAAGIVILIVMMIVFASWPRDDAGAESRAAAGKGHAEATAVPAAHRSAEDKSAAAKGEYSPIY